ncbi:RNA recognition motif-containing protein [Toxoplasma gondii TgCatPRC2]|uniref:RNA recognition motif-containing protein n=1 Tax=Toxoplasma gondii TgCatPRC2 TaxID=1130821 RepID=A0A151HCP8_TOXGO|nr:RNA recognition motif-containing protein [Toxoplasma gondii TgCatPRC2]
MKSLTSKGVAARSSETVGEAAKQTPKRSGGKSGRPRSGLRSREGGKQSDSHALSRSEGAEVSAASRASAAGRSSVQRERGEEKRRFRRTDPRGKTIPGSSAETEASGPRGSSSSFYRKNGGRDGERRAVAVGDNSRRERGYGAPKTEEERAAERKRSVFVSNLPPDASREELDELFRSFGSLATIKLVGSAADDRSKEGKGITGSAFVIFKDEASAQQALTAYSAAPFQGTQSAAGRSSEKGEGTRFSASSALPPGMSVFAAEALGVSWKKANEAERREAVTPTARQEVLLRGQPLLVRPVLSREEAGKLKGQSGWTRKEDSASRRHLNLAFEGMISPKSAAFEELPPAEQRRRLQAWREKKEKMKNPNYFVNPTRLSVRNLPTSTSANELRETMSHFLLKSPAFAEFESSRLAQREAEREARKRREANTAGAEKSTQGEGQKPRVTDFSLLHPKQQRRLAEQAILKVRIIRDKERRRATSSQENGSTTKEKRSLGFAFVDCSHAEVAKLLLNFLGMCTSDDFLPENLAAQKQGGETEEETPRHGRTMWRRLMVEYAMEDARKVKLKEEKSRAYVQMLERQKKKNQGGEEGDEQPGSGKASLPKKLKTYSRGKRQRERRRQARLAVAGVTDPQTSLHGVGREKPREKNKVPEQSSEGQKKLSKASVNESKRPKEAEKRKKNREDDEASAGDEILVFDEDGETDESRIYPKRIKSHADSRRRRKRQRRSEQDNENLEDEYLKSRVQFLLSNQG